MSLFRIGGDDARPNFDPLPGLHSLNARVASLEQELAEKDEEISQLRYLLAERDMEDAAARWRPSSYGRVVRLSKLQRPALRLVGDAS